MRTVILACGVIAGTALPAAAVGLCETLEAMIAGRKVASTEARHCGTSQALSGTTSQHCRWPFAFRAPEALAAFEAMTAEVAACLQAPARAEEADVNHPDTYDQRLFGLANGTVSVALKDKGALQQTFVFLRVETNTP